MFVYLFVCYLFIHYLFIFKVRKKGVPNRAIWLLKMMAVFPFELLLGYFMQFCSRSVAYKAVTDAILKDVSVDETSV